MRLLFVGDGPRDHATVPEIVGRVLNRTIHSECRAWKGIRLRRGKGYGRKLRYALTVAVQRRLDGVVATVDSDNDSPGERLSSLRSARDSARQIPNLASLRAALGEAVPHLEAWLLDDPKAVRDALQLDKSVTIPNVRKVEPKAALDAIIDESGLGELLLDLLARIASHVDINRCNHSDDTGFAAFVDEITGEFCP